MSKFNHQINPMSTKAKFTPHFWPVCQVGWLNEIIINLSYRFLSGRICISLRKIGQMSGILEHYTMSSNLQ